MPPMKALGSLCCAQVATGVIMPFIAIFAYLLTPMTPPEDPDEPEAFSLDDLQQYTPGCVQGCIDAFDSLRASVGGWAMGILGALLAPFAAQIAKGIQLSMGFSSILEVYSAFAHIPNVATYARKGSLTSG